MGGRIRVDTFFAAAGEEAQADGACEAKLAPGIAVLRDIEELDVRCGHAGDLGVGQRATITPIGRTTRRCTIQATKIVPSMKAGSCHPPFVSTLVTWSGLVTIWSRYSAKLVG